MVPVVIDGEIKYVLPSEKEKIAAQEEPDPMDEDDEDEATNRHR